MSSFSLEECVFKEKLSRCWTFSSVWLFLKCMQALEAHCSPRASRFGLQLLWWSRLGTRDAVFDAFSLSLHGLVLCWANKWQDVSWTKFLINQKGFVRRVSSRNGHEETRPTRSRDPLFLARFSFGFLLSPRLSGVCFASAMHLVPREWLTTMIPAAPSGCLDGALKVADSSTTHLFLKLVQSQLTSHGDAS